MISAVAEARRMKMPVQPQIGTFIIRKLPTHAFWQRRAYQRRGARWVNRFMHYELMRMLGANVCVEKLASRDHTPPPLVVPPRLDFRVLASPSTVRRPRPRRPGLPAGVSMPAPGALAEIGQSG